MQMSNLFGQISIYILIVEVFLDVGMWVYVVEMGPFYEYLIFGYKTQLFCLEMEEKQAAAAA